MHVSMLAKSLMYMHKFVAKAIASIVRCVRRLQICNQSRLRELPESHID